MPKKVHGRSAPKSKTRARPSPTRPLSIPAEPPIAQDELIPTAPASRGVVAAQSSSVPTRPMAAASTARRAVSARRAPVLAINYHYLRGDIRMLTLLAPSMIALLVIAFFVFR